MIETRMPASALPASVPFGESFVDLSRIADNLATVRAIAGTAVMAVVKADAFGHGAVQVARAAVDAGAEWLGVATIGEALDLRRAGVSAPVLAWLVDSLSDIDTAIAAHVTLSCGDVATLEAVADAAMRTGRRAAVHLELDTGMSRAGAGRSEWRALFSAARFHSDAGRIDVDGIWSHLATASSLGDAGVARQLDAFIGGMTAASRVGVNPRLLHLANSAAALAHPECRFSMVRVGAALYGIETVEGTTFGLRSAMRVTSRVSRVRRVAPGVHVGYAPAHRIERATTLALVPLGYADGVPRALSNRGSVTIGGRRHPIVGSISMDQFVVDVGDHPVSAGDTVVLLGSADAGEADPGEWARLTGTVAHEIVTGLGGRIVRRHRSW